MITKKVCVIGLDGASPLLINAWLDELPTFRRFKDEGLWGPSIPPLPAQTPVAWTTFMTGQNPGKHGIFSFIQREVGSYQRRIASPSAIKTDTLWQILSAHGKRVGVLNVPMSSYNRINGFMIPGFLDRQEGIPQPRSIREVIRKRFGIGSMPGDVETDILAQARSNPELLLNRIEEITELNAKISLYLLENEPWDFFMTVLMGTDRIGHFFWNSIDPTHPHFTNNEFTDRAKRYYQSVDKILAGFLKRIPSNTLSILVSDHGFCPVTHEIFLNNYLQQQKYLHVQDEKVDLTKSLAVAYGYGDIWLNIIGREPTGIIQPGHEYQKACDEIIKLLQNIRIYGESPIQQVVRREDVYWGPYVSEAADLIAIHNKNWQSARRPEILLQTSKDGYFRTNPLWSGGHDGSHNPEEVPGILGFLGPALKKEQSPFKAHLWDVAPTILQYLDISIPQAMDGRPLALDS
jgi:predicted AlkP superfamily phosphohydrolase/phosphomutase